MNIDKEHMCLELRSIVESIERGDEVHLICCVARVSGAGPCGVTSHTHGNPIYIDSLLFHALKHHLFDQFRNNLTFQYPKHN